MLVIALYLTWKRMAYLEGIVFASIFKELRLSADDCFVNVERSTLADDLEVGIEIIAVKAVCKQHVSTISTMR
jgi:hypothetical protein